MKDYPEWLDDQRRKEFMADTRSLAAYIVAGILIGICVAAALVIGWAL